MGDPMGDSKDQQNLRKQDARFHLANERTLLAWLRTSIGIMAFGFVVVKFSIFIKQLAYLVGKDVVVPQSGYSSFIGILLVAVGAIVILLAFIKFKQTEQRITDDSYRPSSKLITFITTIILIISVLLILYLISNSLAIKEL
ncbi:MAG TPA: DUF202 domain-containing protein [Chryseosolibacter sp.]